MSVLTYGGQFVTSFDRKGVGREEFDLPTGMAFNNSGVLYVCDNLL